MPNVDLELTGLATDLPPFKYPPNVWTRARNIEMGDGFPSRARGYGEVYASPLFVPRWLQPIKQLEFPNWFYAGDTGFAVTDGNTHTDLTGGFTVDSTGSFSPITGGVINSNVVCNNIDAVPVYWQPGTPAVVPLPDWDTDWRCRSMRVFREFLIAMGMTEGAQELPDLLRWSDRAPAGDVPQSWTAGPVSLAGSSSPAFGQGPIVDGVTLRDQFLVFKQHTTFVLQLIGGQLVMAQRPLFSTFGMLTRNCAVEFRGSLIVLTDGDLIRTNGLEAESIVDRRVKGLLFDELDGDNYQNSYLALDKEREEVWICVPTEGSVYPNRALVYSLADNEFGFRELGDLDSETTQGWPFGTNGVVDVDLSEPTWESRTTTWETDNSRWNEAGASPNQETMLFSETVTPTAAKLQAIGEGTGDFDGVQPVAELERIGLNLGQPDRFKFIKRIWPRLDGNPGATVEIRVGGQADPDGPVTWDQWRTFEIGVGDSLGCNARGRYLAIGMRSSSAAAWRVPGFTVEIEPMGTF